MLKRTPAVKTILQIVVILTTIALCSPLRAYAIPSTAREWLSTAIRSAQRWQSDAKLVRVVTLEGLEDGKAERWSYEFYSESSKSAYAVRIRDGWVGPNDEQSPASTKELPTKFTDSTVAMARARAQRSLPKDGIEIVLQMVTEEAPETGAYWSISVPHSDHEIILINALEE